MLRKLTGIVMLVLLFSTLSYPVMALSQTTDVPLAQADPDSPDAEPPVTTSLTTTPAGDTSVVLVIDNTGSMSGAKLQSAIAALNRFVDGLADNVPVAVVTFSDTADLSYGFTTDHVHIQYALNQLRAGGDAALYDGALVAVQTALRATTPDAAVIVVTDGGEFASLSRSEREDAIALAEAEQIPVITVGIGAEADTEYLSALSAAGNASAFAAETPADLESIFVNVLEVVEGGAVVTTTDAAADDTVSRIPSMSEGDFSFRQFADEMAASLLSPSVADSTFGQSSVPVPGSGSPLVIPLPGSSVATFEGSEQPVETTVSRIPPIEDEITDLNLDVQETVIEPAAESAVTTDAQPAPVLPADDLTSNIVPISVQVDPSTDIEVAELAINGYRLGTFEQAPYQFDLDTTVLDKGFYNLTFTIVNSMGVVSSGSLDFEVVVIESLPDADTSVDNPFAGSLLNGAPAGTTGASAPTSGANNPTVDSVGDEPVAAAPTDDLAERILLIEGRRQPFNLQFAPDSGLSMIAPPVEALIEPSNSLIDILSEPANNLIPQPVREALTAPRPREASIVIMLMTLTLLPQGFFTLYWMLYAWNNPKAIERAESPKQFMEPQHSFTALVPARHEEDVIKQTIYAVDRIEYPDELKEILILCRDDDQGTIAKAREAIEEIGKDNIRVVTFSTGPINKPHGLNIGLKEATKEIIAVFDAEDEPNHELYNVINTVMLRDGADVVQSGVQLMNFKSTWFSAINVLEYFFWFKSGLHCFTRQFKVTPLGGNTVFFRKYFLDRVGGWDENCLTEDADIGIRLTLHGARIQIVYDAMHATQEETPATVESFIKQRTRWNQGFYQVFFKGEWAKLPEFKQRVTALYILLNSLLQAAIVLYLPIGLFIAMTQQVSVPIALFSYLPIYLLFMQLLTNLIGIREFTEAYGLRLPFGFRLKMIVGYYPYQLILAVAAVRAIYRFITQNQAWEKTTHANLHRQGVEPVLRQS